MTGRIYLDCAAMYPTLDCAREAYAAAPFGNPSSPHMAGQEARDALESARTDIAVMMDCNPDEVYFFSTATEAAATVLTTLAEKGITVDRCPYEHHAVSENIRTRVSSEKAYAHLLVNNETGESYLSLFGTRERKNCILICDATAAVGHMTISFKSLGCDYLFADAIKFGGVPGAAFLIAKKDAPLSPIIRGGGQERGIRSGTENVPAICAMAQALKWQLLSAKTVRLNTMSCIEPFIKILPSYNGQLLLNSPNIGASHILNFSFMGVDANVLALMLSERGVMLSPGGAACSSREFKPSHVLMHMFNDEQRAISSVRISISCMNTAKECEQAAKIIVECANRILKISGNASKA